MEHFFNRDRIYTLYLVCIGALLCLSISSPVLSEEDTPPGLEKNYFALTIHKNYPIGKTEGFLDPGGYSYGLRYFHTLDNRWIMSVSGNFKNFTNTVSGGHRSIATACHETLAMVRIYYPAYFLFGVRTMYLLPSLNNSIPPKRDPLLDAEVGVGLSAYIFAKMKEDYTLFFRTGRWRGTKTTRLQAYDVSLGIGRTF